MDDGLDTRLDSAFRAAAKDRAAIEDFKEQARKYPLETAERIVQGVPQRRRNVRENAVASYGIDVSKPETLKDWVPRSLADEVVALQALNTYGALGAFQRHIEALWADGSLPEGERAAQICEAGIAIFHMEEANLLHTLHEIRCWAVSNSDEKAQRVALEAEALHLAGHLATRISLRNGLLRKAVDEIRAQNKPAKRARFEALLRELFIHAPAVWAEYHNDDLNLRATRGAVVREMERAGRTTPVQEAAELAAFAERELLLKNAREAGLTPREQELFRLVLGDPKRFFRSSKLNAAEAAREMGVATGTVKSLWARIKKTLAA